MADVKKLAEELVNLSVKDVQELANILKEEYGIEPAAATVVAAAADGGAAAEAEQTEFDEVELCAATGNILEYVTFHGKTFVCLDGIHYFTYEGVVGGIFLYAYHMGASS